MRRDHLQKAEPFNGAGLRAQETGNVSKGQGKKQKHYRLTKGFGVSAALRSTSRMAQCLEVYQNGSGWTRLNVNRLKENGLFVHRVSSDTVHICPEEVHTGAEHTIERLPALTHYHPDALLTAAERFMGHSSASPLHVYPTRTITCCGTAETGGRPSATRRLSSVAE